MRIKLLMPILLIMLVGCSASKPPISVTSEVNPWLNLPYLKVLSLENDVNVENVQINGGNCKNMSERVKLPQKVGMGQSFTIATAGCGQVIEVEIGTNKGDFTFTFEK